MRKLILGLSAVLFLSCGEKKDENQINLGDYNHDPIDSTTTVAPPGSFSSDTTAVDSLSNDSTQNDSTKANTYGTELPI